MSAEWNGKWQVQGTDPPEYIYVSRCGGSFDFGRPVDFAVRWAEEELGRERGPEAPK